MEYITWDDSYSVNIDSIDNQHKKLFNEINKFYENIGKKRNNEVLADILFQLARYSVYHFQTEEQWMKKYGYKNYINHKKEHDFFIDKINELQNRLKEGKLVLSIELTSFLKTWLSNHIQKSDKAYSHFLNECGVK